MALLRRGQRDGLAGILSSTGSGIFNLAAGIVLVPIILHTVGAGPYGVWLFVSALATYLNYSDLGIGAAVVHFGSRFRSGREERGIHLLLHGALLWVSLVLTVILPLFAVVIHLYLAGAGASRAVAASDRALLLAVGLLMLSGLLLKPFASALIAWGYLPTERAHQSIGVLLRIAGTLIACFAFQSLVLVACVEVAATIVPNALSALRVNLLQKQSHIPGGKREQMRLTEAIRAAWNAMRYMLGYSSKSFGVSAAGALVLQSGVLVLGVTSTPESVSYYNAAFRIYASIRQLITWVTDPMRSALSRVNADDSERARRVLLGICLLTSWLVFLGCGTLALAAPFAVPLWLGGAVPASEIVVTMSILLLGLALNSVHLPLSPAGDAAGKPGVFLLPQLFWLIATVISTLFLADKLGPAGAALGLTLPLALVEPAYLWIASRKLGLSLQEWARRVLLPVLLPGVTAGLLVSITDLLTRMIADQPAQPLLLAAVYCVTFILITLVPWSRSSWSNVQVALKEKL